LKAEAVTTALAGNCQEAADLNYQASEQAPDDVGTYNRLATALIELGRFSEARTAAHNVLTRDPDNKIARKHADRLAQLDGPVARAPTTSDSRIALRFITDSAKATVTELLNPATAKNLATVSPGQQLFPKDNSVRMESHTRVWERIGTLESILHSDYAN
jgi:tetratricopeptide (TPR) repeat protein